MSFCCGIAWSSTLGKMSPNTTKAQRLLSGSTFSPVQSSNELSLCKESSDAGRMGYILQPTSRSLGSYQVSSVTEVLCPGPRHTRFLCILHDRDLVDIALESLEKKNSTHWTITPPPTGPTLPCQPSAWLNLTTLGHA